jgi:prepilin-type N-terminal cleavage/methylation domain-containing protein
VRRSAFTLIEILAVLTLLGMLTALAAVSLSSAVRAARSEDAVEAFCVFDRSARDYAKRFGRTPMLRFDLNRGIVSRVEEGKQAMQTQLPVKRVISRADDRTSGEVTVPVSETGQSPSYAVLVNVASGPRWIVFAGLTGQSMVVSNESEVLDILAPARADAD